jgi:hypothetical protein
MPILINDWKLLLSSMILLCNIFPEIKIQWRMIWRSKHQVSDEIKKIDFQEKLDVLVCQIGWSDFELMCSATICSAKPSSTKLDGLVYETGGSGISKISDESSETMMTDPNDWRKPLVRYFL